MTSYFHKDHLGSTAAVTGEDGLKKESTTYEPFGSTRTQDGTPVSSYKFTDQELDNETNLYNYDARLYDPVLGMFVTPDSIINNVFDPQNLNPYRYCRNNPLIYTDPSGHVEIVEVDRGNGESIDLTVRPNKDSKTGFSIVENKQFKELTKDNDFLKDVLRAYATENLSFLDKWKEKSPSGIGGFVSLGIKCMFDSSYDSIWEAAALSAPSIASKAAGGIIGMLGTIKGVRQLGEQKNNIKGQNKSNYSSKPKDCPTGTLPVDQSKLSREDIHKIKEGVGAGPRDWTGISPNGDVITTDANGNAINHEPASSFFH